MRRVQNPVRVERLMRRTQFVARPRRRRVSYDLGPRPDHCIAANVLDRQRVEARIARDQSRKLRGFRRAAENENAHG